MISAQGKISVGVLLALIVAYSMPARADDTPTYFSDPATGCRLGSFSSQPGLVPHWSGKCLGGFAEGPGIAEWQLNGQFNSRSEGSYHAGLREGLVINVNLQGTRAEGAFHNGHLNGRCIVTEPTRRIEGQCVDGTLNGPGKADFKDGGHYEGDFKDGHFTGKGVWVFANGSRWEGDFLDGELNGRGRKVYQNESYEGDLVAGKYEGTGTYHFPDGGVYEGEWTNNLPNGRGVFHGIPNGLFGMRRDFAGTWVNGCFSQPPLSVALFKKRAACGFDD